jgi:probable phosphoglycerate mutase
MTRILLIRHGHTELLGKVLYGRMAGVHLSAQGKEEIQRLAVALKERYTLDEILSSPLDRTRETAEAIASLQQQSITYDTDIQELDYGEWMGRSFGQLFAADEWKRYSRSRSLSRAPGGEFMMQVQYRAWSALERAIERHVDKPEATIAMVSHGDVVRGLLLLFLGMPIDFIHRLEAAPASVSEVLIGDSHPVVIKVNQTF